MYMMQNYTHIASHNSICCKVVQEWLFAMDTVYTRLENSPLHVSWIYDQYTWGPNKYPFFWCDLLKTQTIDCGVFADLVQTIFQHRGIECSRIQQYGLAHESQKDYWKEKWASAGVDFSHWIVDDTFIYHEMLVINQDGLPIFFDTTTGLIIDDESPFADPVIYMKLCQPMSIPVAYNRTSLKPLEWTSL